MIRLAERHGFGNLGTIIAWISEKRPLFLFFGVTGAVFTIIGLISGANVLYIANAGGVAVGSTLVSVLFIIIGVFSVFTGLRLNAIGKGKEKE